jgi:lipoprotein LprG
MTTRRRDGAALFATVALALAGAAMAGAISAAAGFGPLVGESAESANDGGGSGATRGVNDGDDGAVADPDADPLTVRAGAAEAMAAVTSVQFTLGLTGEPIFIDAFESIALEGLTGQFAAPGKAQASLDVEVDGGLRTRIGAIAIDDEMWISNPVTGEFETLPAGYDINPAGFFDPEGGWYPLIAGLQDVEMVGVEHRGGERWHLRGVADAADVRNVTAGLVRDQALPVDLWIHPQSSLVTAVELTTVLDGGETHWVLELERYGDEFAIEAP